MEEDVLVCGRFITFGRPSHSQLMISLFIVPIRNYPQALKHLCALGKSLPDFSRSLLVWVTAVRDGTGVIVCSNEDKGRPIPNSGARTRQAQTPLKARSRPEAWAHTIHYGVGLLF
jgi:hypothetical protein